MFRILKSVTGRGRDDGFQIEFSNGMMISVRIGPASMCSNASDVLSGDMVSPDAEVCILDKEGAYATSDFLEETGRTERENVLGNVSADTFALMVAWCSKK